MKPLLRGASAALGVGAAMVGLFGSACASSTNDSGGPERLSYLVMPHPDDEMQAWSLFEDSPETYKIFIMLTKGEQTAYCASPGYDEGTGEAAPTPWPDGRWTPSCEAARQNSFFDFVGGMGGRDSGLPTSFTSQGVKGPFDALGHTICRHDDGGCIADLTAEVWTSPVAAVVWFNVGDGDVTEGEVAWAVTTVRDNRAALGINSSLPNHGLIGASYWNRSHPGCVVYDHDDHRAVHEALWNTNFDVGYQAAAACGSDPEIARSEQVSLSLFDTAFETKASTRIGEHAVHYGWLNSDGPGYWPGDYSGQDELYHRDQAFWVRFGSS